MMVESVFGQQCDLSGDGPGGVGPGKYRHAEAVREREAAGEAPAGSRLPRSRQSGPTIEGNDERLAMIRQALET